MMFVAAKGLVPVVGRPAPGLDERPDCLIPLGIETMAERRYVRLLAAFMQVRHASQPFTIVRS